MSQPSSGDLIWDAALRALAASETGTIRAADVQECLEGEVNRRQITRRLNGMEALGWLERDHPEGRTWHASARATRYLAPTSDNSDG